jgi:hypothetical protein
MSDQATTAPSVWERSTFVRLFRWLFSWRGIRRVLIVLAWMATIIGLWYGEENWRGRHAWNQYRESAEARGESFDFATYIPKPVPEAQNFAATPFLKSFVLTSDELTGLGQLTNDLFTRATDHVTETNLMKDRGHRHFMDLVAWQLAAAALQKGALKREQNFETDQCDLAAREAAAPAVLEGMKPDQAAFAELRAASTRDFSRYPLKYDLENPWGILVPHLARIKGVCVRLNLETCAELASGQESEALADEKLMFALADSIKSEPFLISFLVRLSCVQIAIQPAWEGLAERRWTDASLQELQARFLAYDFLADLQPSLKAERACGVQAVDLLKGKGLRFLSNFSDDSNPWQFDKAAFDLLRNFMPAGWYDRERLNYCRLFEVQNGSISYPASKGISPSKVAADTTQLEQQIYYGIGSSGFKGILRHRLIAALLLPSLQKIPFKVARTQAATDQAALACALERYRLAHGQFPEQLDALSPQFVSHLPNDVITGKPYKYRRTDDGQFILYSVGWNEKDDGGVPGKTLFDETAGDWVWSYPKLSP